MKRVLVEPVSNLPTIPLEEVDIRKHILINVFEGVVGFVVEYSSDGKAGFATYNLINSSRRYSWATHGSFEDFKKRVKREKGPNEEFYVFTSMQELANAIIDNGWE